MSEPTAQPAPERVTNKELDEALQQLAAARAEVERLKTRAGEVFSEVIVHKDGAGYKGTWYDYSGHEYAHVTETWLAARLFEQTGHEWTVRISEHGNGHYSAVATSKDG